MVEQTFVCTVSWRLSEAEVGRFALKIDPKTNQKLPDPGGSDLLGQVWKELHGYHCMIALGGKLSELTVMVFLDRTDAETARTEGERLIQGAHDKFDLPYWPIRDVSVKALVGK